MSISLDAKEVLFHLNYMGYRNVSKEQLKSFMFDLKKLIKYESSPREFTEVQVAAAPSSFNVQRLFESHTIASKTKQSAKPKENKATEPTAPRPKQKPQQTQLDSKENVDPKTNSRPSRVSSANSAASKSRPSVNFTDKPEIFAATGKKVIEKKLVPLDKDKDKENVPAKSKMWIRPKSASQAGRSQARKNDPVSLYQSYQKDWEKFKSNICESSHSDLRWSIREKMMSNR